MTEWNTQEYRDSLPAYTPTGVGEYTYRNGQKVSLDDPAKVTPWQVCGGRNRDDRARDPLDIIGPWPLPEPMKIKAGRNREALQKALDQAEPGAFIDPGRVVIDGTIVMPSHPRPVTLQDVQQFAADIKAKAEEAQVGTAESGLQSRLADLETRMDGMYAVLISSYNRHSLRLASLEKRLADLEQREVKAETPPEVSPEPEWRYREPTFLDLHAAKLAGKKDIPCEVRDHNNEGWVPDTLVSLSLYDGMAEGDSDWWCHCRVKVNANDEVIYE